MVEFQSQVLLGIQGTGDTDKGVGEVGIQVPVALLVGVGEGALHSCSLGKNMLQAAGASEGGSSWLVGAFVTLRSVL